MIKIKRKDSYADNRIIAVGMDLGRSIAINKGEIIEVTEEELKVIGQHRWLEIIKEETQGEGNGS